MQDVWLTTPHGSHRGALASSFRDRLLGIRRIGDAELVIIPGSSVHGVGLDAPLDAVGISSSGVITRVATLRPGRFLRFGGAALVAESPQGSVTWREGERIAMRRRDR